MLCYTLYIHSHEMHPASFSSSTMTVTECATLVRSTVWMLSILTAISTAETGQSYCRMSAYDNAEISTTFTEITHISSSVECAMICSMKTCLSFSYHSGTLMCKVHDLHFLASKANLNPTNITGWNYFTYGVYGLFFPNEIYFAFLNCFLSLHINMSLYHFKETSTTHFLHFNQVFLKTCTCIDKMIIIKLVLAIYKNLNVSICSLLRFVDQPEFKSFFMPTRTFYIP